MKKSIIAFCIFFGIIYFSACEKDDICVDGDEPLLVIRFYDNDAQTEFKDVTSLIVRGYNSPDTLAAITNAALDSIALPLRINETSTTFLLSRQLKDEEVNLDILTFSHKNKEVFISRACGFVANYENLNPSLTTDSDNWIKNIEVVNPTVKDIDSAHVKIFH